MTAVTSVLPLRLSLEVVSQYTGDPSLNISVLQIQLYQFHYLQLLGFGMVWFGKGEGFDEEVEVGQRTVG